MRHRKKLTALIAALIISVISTGIQHFGASSGAGSAIRQEVSALDASQIWTRTRNMSASENAAHHFQKHGHEFGFRSEPEYIAAAVAFTTEPLPTGVMKNIQKDDDTAYYNPKTAEYAVKSKKGRIRTYFKLDPRIHGYKSNTDYFNAHAKVGAGGVANDNNRQLPNQPANQPANKPEK